MRGRANGLALAAAAAALAWGWAECGGEMKGTPGAGGPPPPSRGAPPPVVERPPGPGLAAALALARSARAEDQAALLKSLDQEEYLSRLEPLPDAVRRQLPLTGLAEVTRALAANRSPAARRTLLGLTGARTFLTSDRRAALLIGALAALRPPPAEVLRFWDERSAPEAIGAPFVIDALCENGTAPAVRLLEAKLIDPRQDPDARRGWILGAVLRHRNDLALLRGCSRLIVSLPAALRPVLVDALFDYRREWYRSDAPPVPPERRLASPAARQELRRIGTQALAKVRLSEAQKRAVRKVLRGIPPAPARDG